jgi:hypothetical protein
MYLPRPVSAVSRCSFAVLRSTNTEMEGHWAIQGLQSGSKHLCYRAGPASLSISFCPPRAQKLGLCLRSLGLPCSVWNSCSTHLTNLRNGERE